MYLNVTLGNPEEADLTGSLQTFKILNQKKYYCRRAPVVVTGTLQFHDDSEILQKYL